MRASERVRLRGAPLALGSRRHTRMRLAALSLTLALVAPAGAQERPQVRSLRITVLSTMLAGDFAGGIGEWGFAALVEADGRRILFDTGARPETVLANAKELGTDLAGITDLVISAQPWRSHRRVVDPA